MTSSGGDGTVLSSGDVFDGNSTVPLLGGGTDSHSFSLPLLALDGGHSKGDDEQGWQRLLAMVTLLCSAAVVAGQLDRSQNGRRLYTARRQRAPCPWPAHSPFSPFSASVSFLF